MERAVARAEELVRSHSMEIRDTAGLLIQREFLRAEQVAAIVGVHTNDWDVDAPAEPKSSASPPREA